MLIYADDTTLYSTLDVSVNYTSKKINFELTNVADWLNKLSISIKKIQIHGISYASKTNRYT